MRMHQVQVDNDIFEFVKSNAEPLVDDFNSALRKLLSLSPSSSLRTRAPSGSSKAAIDAPAILSLGKQVPIALRHTLEVAHLVRTKSYSRTEATNFVARKDGVYPQTVQDKYCRQLALTTREFDDLLDQSDARDLRRLLKSKFPNFGDEIDRTLG